MSDLLYETKKIKCNVCGGEFFPHKDGVCWDTPVIGNTSYWDYMDCPYCGVQILLKKRLFSNEIAELLGGSNEAD